MVAVPELQSASLRIELFESLKPHEINTILVAGRWKRYAAKSLMMRQGDVAKHLILIWKGRARYFYETQNGRKLILMWVMPGQFIALTALSSKPFRYSLNSEAVSDCIALSWDSKTIRALGYQFPQLMHNAFDLALDHARRYAARYVSMVSQTAQERLANFLEMMSPRIGRLVDDGTAIDVTNQELADCVGITPFAVSRLMSAWQKTSAIRKSRGKIVVRSPRKLFVPITEESAFE